MCRASRLALMLSALCACDEPVVDEVNPVGPLATTHEEVPSIPEVSNEGTEALDGMPSPIRIDVESERTIDAAAAEAMRDDGLPGAVVLIGDAEGLHFARAYGSLSLRPVQAPSRLDAFFDLASITKVFTALAVLRLVDAGTLDLEEDAGRHFAPLRGVSVEDLLLHRAGFPPVDSLADYGPDRAANIARIIATPRGDSGTFRYSDLGYIVLGAIVAKMHEKPLNEALADLVIDPLGLGARFAPLRDPALPVESIAPTEFAPRRAADGEPPPMIRGEVHDPRAYRLCGVAGHAGLFGRAVDVAGIARVLLGGGPDGFLSSALRRRMLTPVQMGEAQRGLGLDAFRGGLAHRGFTGTFLHIRPDRGRFAVVLANAVHPDGTGDAAPLRDAVRAAADAAELLPEPLGVAFGIDVLRADSYARLEGERVALFTHDAAVARDGLTTRRLLSDAPNVDVRVLFSPEHGFGADREGAIHHEQGQGGVRAFSLFGADRDPPDEAFALFDTLVIDIQDVGVRFYTYFASMHRLLRAAAAHETPVVILDRPNPLGGTRVAGPLVADERRTFINHHSLPIMHGLSAGEMARLLVAEDELNVTVDVVRAVGWRGETWRTLGLRWVPPSPNLRSLDAVELYPGVALVEGANVSVGRGTETPFQLVGAPYVDADRLRDAVAQTGGSAVVTSFRPTARPFATRSCRGVRLEPQDDPVALGLALIAALAQEPEFTGERLAGLLASDEVLQAALASAPGLRESFRDAEEAFEARRRPHLLYERRRIPR